MNLCICGLTAAGKSYQAKKIVQEFGLEYISAGDLILENYDITANTDHFWISKDGQELSKRRFNNQVIDRQVDKYILKISETRDNTIFDSWVLPWLNKNLYKIYLKVSLNERARRASVSKETKPYSIEQLRERISKKDEDAAKLFKEMYGFDILDYSFFDLIVDSTELKPAETSQKIFIALRSVLRK